MKKVFGVFEEDLIELPRVNKEIADGARIVSVIFIPHVNEPLFVLTKNEE